MSGQSHTNGGDPGRRKVRKGTHSCWECRRRKIRCQYTHDNDTICIACRARGSSCRSQEFADEATLVPPERKVTMRLDRLESMMERLMQHILAKRPGGSVYGSRSPAAASQQSYVRPSSPSPSAADDGATGSVAKSTAGENGFASEVFTDPSTAAARACPSMLKKHGYASVDVFDTSAVDDTPVAALLGIQQALAQVDPADGSQQDGMTCTDESGSGSGSGSSTAATETSPDAHPGSATAADGDSKYGFLSKTLRSLFPAQADMDAIARGSAAYYVVSLFHSQHDRDAGRGELPESLAVVPPAGSHPAVLARRLLQLTLCMQQAAPARNGGHGADSKARPPPIQPDVVGRIADMIAHTVAASDELIGNVEGLQCLVLLGQQQSNCGHLRQAWLSYRRALGMAQLMGLDRGHTRALKSRDPGEDPQRRPTPAALWFRILACERYLSLMLGLRAGTPDGGGIDFCLATDTPGERLAKAHTLLTGRLVERNHGGTAVPYAVTQAIDADLQAAATRDLDPAWWDVPAYDPRAPPAFVFGQTTRSVLQVNHYCILILLHLPFMLRGSDSAASAAAAAAVAVATAKTSATNDGYAGIDPTTAPTATTSSAATTASTAMLTYSRDTCMRASRALLRRFISFRQLVSSANSCRHVDYSSLIAAMTLIIGYLGPRPSPALPPAVHAAFDAQLLQDRAMVEQVRDLMQHMGSANKDRLSLESAATIQKLLPLLDLVLSTPDAPPFSQHVTPASLPPSRFAAAASASAFASPPAAPPMTPVRLNVPYFGTVNIHPHVAAATGTPTSAIPPHVQQQNHPAHLAQTTTLDSSSASSSSSPAFGLLSPQPGAPRSADPAVLAWHSDLSMAEAGPLEAPDLSTMLVDFDTMTDDNVFDGFGATAAFPDMTGASDDWAMQGVDTTYWSLLNGGGGAFGWGMSG